MRKLLLIALLIVLTGCAKHIPIHPGSISNLDSYAYDSLLIEQDIINGAKAQFASGAVNSADFKHVLNIAITQYNVAEEQWQLYHKSGANAAALQQALDALVLAVGQVQEYLGKKPASSGPVSRLWMGTTEEFGPQEFILVTPKPKVHLQLLEVL